MEITLDIETQNTFQEIGKYDHKLLRASLVGIHNSETNEYMAYREEQIPELWPLFERADRLIGYNIHGFDLLVLNNYYAGDLLKLPTLDVMDEIVKVTGFRPKLDAVAQATLGVAKSGHGLKAIEYFKNGEWEKLTAYCLDDVKITRMVLDFGRQHGYVKYTDMRGGAKEAKVNFSPQKERSAVNLTLGL